MEAKEMDERNGQASFGLGAPGYLSARQNGILGAVNSPHLTTKEKWTSITWDDKAQIVVVSGTLTGLEVSVSEVFRDITMKDP